MEIWSKDTIDTDFWVLMLLTPEEFERLPDGSQVFDINGEAFIKGLDKELDEDRDTRAGVLAFGLRVKCYPQGWRDHVRSIRDGNDAADAP